MGGLWPPSGGSGRVVPRGGTLHCYSLIRLVGQVGSCWVLAICLDPCGFWVACRSDEVGVRLGVGGIGVAWV